MKSVALKAYPREGSGTTASRKVRASGRIPAVIYGPKIQPRNLEVEAKDIDQLLKDAVSEHLLVDLSIDQDETPSRLTLLQQVQHHPLKGSLLHVDFHEVDPDAKAEIEVPVETRGTAEGVKTGGGTLEHVLFNIRVRALPKNLPEFIEIDVTQLQTGETIHIGDIPAPEGVELLGDKDIPVVSVSGPKQDEEELGEGEGAGGSKEPEMIKEKKEA